MNNITTITKTFACPLGGSIRVFVINGETWFVGRDVAEKLGYSRPSNAIQDHVDTDDTNLLKYKAYPKTMQASIWQGNDFSDKVLINESGLYALILSSKLPSAKQFKHWVTSEVLPQIRKTGGFIPVSQEDDEKTILSKALLIMKRTVEEKTALLKEQAPLVHFAKAVDASDDSITISEMAKLLTQNGYEIGRTRFFDYLREHEYIFKKSREPRQEWVERGIFEVKETIIHTHHGDEISITPKVTGKGQRYFISLFTEEDDSK